MIHAVHLLDPVLPTLPYDLNTLRRGLTLPCGKPILAKEEPAEAPHAVVCQLRACCTLAPLARWRLQLAESCRMVAAAAEHTCSETGRPTAG